MKKLLVFRLLTLSIMMFATGLITGWWWHELLNRKGERPPSDEQDYRDWFPIQDYSTTLNLPDTPREVIDFERALEERKYDDALVIYQQQERQDTELSQRLKKVFLQKIDEWSDHQDDGIDALERFTQHYYQDLAFLHKLSELYTEQQALEKSIDVLISARSFSFNPDELEKSSDKIHKLSRTLYNNKQKNQQLHEILPFFQKLANLEPDYAFYRFALAQGYIVLDDHDSAIRELELLQTDEEFGRMASRQLAQLLPSIPEEPEEIPSSAIPLLNEGHHYIATAQTLDRSHSRLLIDTGASLTTLPNTLLQELKRRKMAYRVGHTELKTANGMAFAPLYQVKELHLGQYILKNLEVAGLDLGYPFADGLLGMNALGQFHFQIDQDRNHLILSPR
ncbi:retropepsin-like aspartic protease [Endozoicomonas arenosclerae]|uniref:retropepsin-like aspartic protease n=1 Tax=Endozoicomonas arenosclerae TaxID=1633495 RepID=UPI00078127F5|nr:retropepsin-like aspartic protease [Endozoicomonas arenosclerae]